MSVLGCLKKYWLWFLLLFLLLFVIMMLPFAGDQWRSIEADVSSKVTESLQQAGYQWVSVDTQDRGRDVVLAGIAPTAVAKQQAMMLASNATDQHGNVVANSVKWAGEIAPPVELKNPQFSIDFTSDKIVFKGQLANQQQINDLIRAAHLVYGLDRVVNGLSVGSQLKTLPNLRQFIVDTNDKTVKMVVSDHAVTLTGEVKSHQEKTNLSQAIFSRLDDTYDTVNAISIVLPEPDSDLEHEPFGLPIVPPKISICQKGLDALMQQSTILFASSQAIIKAESYPVLAKIINVLDQCPDASVSIVGHTDSSGIEEKNKKLSADRAQAVVAYLIENNIDAQRLSAKGVGSSQPVADNATPNGRAKNRRIQFTVQ